MPYAERTDVPVAKSIDEIRALAAKSGCTEFSYGEGEDRLAVMFARDNRLVRFQVRVPAPGPKTSDADQRRLAQLRKQRARALLLVIKAKLESVASGVETFEEAFLAQVVLPDGYTVAQHAGPALIAAATSGQAPPALLPDYSAGPRR